MSTLRLSHIVPTLALLMSASACSPVACTVLNHAPGERCDPANPHPEPPPRDPYDAPRADRSENNGHILRGESLAPTPLYAGPTHETEIVGLLPANATIYLGTPTPEGWSEVYTLPEGLSREISGRTFVEIKRMRYETLRSRP